jgi:hypothetical protein
VRAATHIYNLPHEVDRLLEAVTHVSQNAARYKATSAPARQVAELD